MIMNQGYIKKTYTWTNSFNPEDRNTMFFSDFNVTIGTYTASKLEDYHVKSAHLKSLKIYA
jgi:hypothetical protein